MSTLKLLFVFLFIGGGAQAEGTERDGRQDTNVNSTVDALTARLSLVVANEEANRQETLSLKQQLQKVHGQLHQVKGDNLHLSQQIQQVKGDDLHLSHQLQQVKEDSRHLSEKLQQVKGDNLHLSQQLQQVKGDNQRQTHLLNQYSAHMENFTQHLQSLDQYRSKLKHLSTTKSLQRAKRYAPRISFSALLWNETNEYGPNDIVKFIFICFNAGGGYNSYTGYFTAPTNAFYYFIVTLVTVTSGPTGDASLLTDGRCHVKIFKINTDFRISGTAHLITDLQPGQRVWVKNYGVRQYLWGYSMFTGFLIFTW